MPDRDAYLAAGAVLPGVDDGAAVDQVVAVQPPVGRKESRRRRWARKSRWLRGGGRYLDIGQYYIGSGVEKVKYCQTTWLHEGKGEERRYRGLGCGNRTLCPACTTYHRDRLAGDAVADMTMAMEGLEIMAGVIPRDFGTKVVCTVPKETSAWIDVAPDRWDKIGAMRKAFLWWARELWPACTGVVGLDFAGESDPVEPHFHGNLYLFPAVRLKDGTWMELDTYIRPEKLESARALLMTGLRKFLGDDAPGLASEGVFWTNSLKTPGQVRHWLRYLYRSPLYDLWKGWDSVDDLGLVHYKVRKLGGDLERVYTEKEVSVPLARVADTPRKWKRVIWFGAFADGVRTKTMASLGLERTSVDDVEEEGWRQVGESLKFVRFRRRAEGGGIVLRTKDGELVEVGDGLASFAPGGVEVSRRTRYRPPG